VRCNKSRYFTRCENFSASFVSPFCRVKILSDAGVGVVGKETWEFVGIDRVSECTVAKLMWSRPGVDRTRRSGCRQPDT
jgi:hypothetical protein